MQVVKRSGRKEEVKFDKIIKRIKSVSKDLNLDPGYLAQKVITGLYDSIPTTNIDNYVAESAAALSTEHPNYGKLAARIAISSLHKETLPSFKETTEKLIEEGMMHESYIHSFSNVADDVDKIINHERDYDFDYFGYKTLERSYLLKIKGRIVERPQYTFMRVALAIAEGDLEKIKKFYDLFSQGYYTHATPTLFNAGTRRNQMSSCFLLALEEDSIDGIYKTIADCATISKNAGGIGVHIHNVRAKGSPIKGTNGTSNGIVPMIKVFNETARYCDQGGGKRKGSFAIYLEPWHRDIEDFLELRKPTGKEELRARDIFLALWVPDLFMERVESNGEWTLMCPNQQAGLSDCYGDEFKKLYERYEKENPDLPRIRAQELWGKILQSQFESGNPYISFKDAVNKKNNQKHSGIIKSSNLCNEINEISTPNETAVCNLASLCLPKFITENGFDFKHLHSVAKQAIYNLNEVINQNYYPTRKTLTSNSLHRPTGLGVQGLCDVFFALNLPYESEQAYEIDRKIHATIYHAALEASCELSRKMGPYTTFAGSPASQGILQFDLWETKPHSDYDWEKLKTDIQTHGLRNSLLLALMPTASTSQIFGNTECFEVVTSNLYKRQTLAGEFVVINKYLVKALESQSLWNGAMRDKIIQNNGSIQNIAEIPANIRAVYKTVWEVPQRAVIDHAAIRAPYICQSQSMNLFFAKPSFGKVTSALFYGWKKGLKTGCYYLRTKPSTDAIKVTTKIDSDSEAKEAIACSINNPESCLSCQ